MASLSRGSQSNRTVSFGQTYFMFPARTPKEKEVGGKEKFVYLTVNQQNEQKLLVP